MNPKGIGENYYAKTRDNSELDSDYLTLAGIGEIG